MDNVKQAPYEPVPPDLESRIRTLTHDLRRARLNLASGHLKPDQYAALANVLDGRLRDIEAEINFRLLNEARTARGGNAKLSWKPGNAG